MARLLRRTSPALETTPERLAGRKSIASMPVFGGSLNATGINTMIQELILLAAYRFRLIAVRGKRGIVIRVEIKVGSGGWFGQ